MSCINVTVAKNTANASEECVCPTSVTVRTNSVDVVKVPPCTIVELPICVSCQGGGGGSGIISGNCGCSLTGSYENSGIHFNISNINFWGTGVYLESGSGNALNVYIPPPAFGPFFNQSTASMSDVFTSIRRISNPVDSSFEIGDWTPGSWHPALQDQILTYSTNNYFRIKETETILKANFSGYNSLISSYQIQLTGNFSGYNSGIEIMVSGFQKSYGNNYQAIATIRYYTNILLPQGGRFSTYIEHDNDGFGKFIKRQTGIFYDPNDVGAVQSGLSINNIYANIKHISAVKYYNTGSEFAIVLSRLDQLNNKSFPGIQVVISGSGYGLITGLSLSGENLSAWTTNYNNTGAYFSGNRTITNNLLQICSVGLNNISSLIYDWGQIGPAFPSQLKNIAINTINRNATRLMEDFREEESRLTQSITPWDSTQNLLTYDDGLGLQLKCDRLIYPKEDFTIYEPTGSPNYFIATGDRNYIRRFFANTKTSSNGLFTFDDTNFTEFDILNEPLFIEISPDNGITWFILNHDYLGGEIWNGDGCRINKDTFPFPFMQFTFGENKYSTTCLIKITIKQLADPNRYLGKVTLSQGNWSS